MKGQSPDRYADIQMNKNKVKKKMKIKRRQELLEDTQANVALWWWLTPVPYNTDRQQCEYCI